MSLAHLARRVRTLERRLAPEVAFIRMRQLADDLCNDWEVALATDCPTPEPQHFIRRVAHAGIKSDTFTKLEQFLDRCREEKKLPEVYEVVRCVLRWSVHLGLISVLREQPDLGIARR